MTHAAAAPPRLALVGDRSPQVRSHQRIPSLLEMLHQRDGLALDAYWVGTADIADESDLAAFDGVWLLPGSPYRSEAGAIAAARCARERGIPLLGTCGGFQHAVLEYARNVCGLTGAAHVESAPGAATPVIEELACSLVGHAGAVHLRPGSVAQSLLAADLTVERYHCSYGLNAGYLDVLRRHGLVFTGADASGEVRVAEFPGHPFYLLTLFQPELADDDRQPHPLIRGFARAVIAHASAGMRA